MEKTTLPSAGRSNITEEQLLDMERRVYYDRCISCNFCEPYDLNEDEIEEQKIDENSEGVCRRYPPHPSYGSPDVNLFQKKCGEFQRV